MDRTDRLLDRAGLASREGILIHKPSNMFYLSGYTGEGLLIAAPGLKAIVTDSRYTEQAQRQAPGFEVLTIETGVSHFALAAKLCARHGIDSLKYEDDHVTVKGYASMQAAMPGITFVSLDNLPEKMRVVKDDGELALMQKAFDISCEAFDHILGFIKPGLTEKQIELALNFKMYELGAEALAFNTIVASGPNGSLPHAIPGERKVESGDMITLDFGAKYQGYCADMTRTVAVGKPKDEMRRIYGIVLRAQTTAQDALAAGKNCVDIDRIARDIIAGEGYGQFFGHGLGHSLGIDVHEDPRLSPVSQAKLETNLVITVEPGIYVPGLGGVRIENSCVITDTAARSLVSAPRELIIL